MPIHNAADNSFKIIFNDHRLFADFIRDFIPIDILKDVKPGDIEDMRERFLPLFEENRDADTVKKINLAGNTPFFIIAILEHESKVNFRSCFKMLFYMYNTAKKTRWLGKSDPLVRLKQAHASGMGTTPEKKNYEIPLRLRIDSSPPIFTV